MKKIVLTFVFLLALLLPGNAQAAGLDLRPLSWDVIGLDSSAPKIPEGPNLFSVGAEICNESGADIADLQSEIVWDTANPYISVDGPSIDNIGALASGDCIDTFFVVRVEKTADAWNTSRGYRILASASGGASGETPSGRQLYVERIISQNRNATKAISGAGGCNADYSVCDPAPTDLEVGREYTYKLYAETSAPHDQLTAFITFPGNIFQVERVRTSYELPPGAEIEGPYADACGWQPDPSLPDYLSCVGPPPAPFAPDGKAGGRVISTYTVKIIGDGQGSLTSLINDHSGSSYHYNNDYGSISIDFQSRFPLSVQVNGQGNVLSDPAGIDCGVTCFASYPEGTLVTLQATPGQTFLGWEGACAGMELTCQVEMTEARNVVANFSGDVFYPLRVETTTGGRVSSDVGGINCPDVLCTQTYESGTLVSLQAEALPGYQFLRWEEDCSADPCSVTMNEPRLVRAIFQPIEPEFHTLLFRQDPRGVGTSTSQPAQSGQINCGISCLATYPDGATVTLRAEALPGYRFVSWGGVIVRERP